MRPVLRPGAPLLRRDAQHLQIGTTPGAAYVLRERPGILPLLRMLDGVRDEHTVQDLVSTEAPQLEGDAVELLDALRAAGAVLDADAWARQPDRKLSAEGRHLAVCGSDPESLTTRLEHRARSRVEISYDEHTAPIAAQVREIVDGSGVPCSLSPLDHPALVVVLTTGPCPRTVFEVLAEGGIAHLPVACEESLVRIGPLVRPGRTPCVGCDDHHRAAWDPAWPGLLAQLDRPLARPAVIAAHALSALVSAFLAVIVAEEVLAHCEGRPTRSEAATMTVGPQPHDLAVHPVRFARACGCEMLTVPESAGPATAGPATAAPTSGLVGTGTMEA